LLALPRTTLEYPADCRVAKYTNGQEMGSWVDPKCILGSFRLILGSA
jgi:hypothetical protein